MPTKIVSCSCDNKFQDERYGKGMRVANQKVSNNTNTKIYRCTVCKKEHSFGESK